MSIKLQSNFKINLPHLLTFSNLYLHFLKPILTYLVIVIIFVPIIVDLYINYLFQINQSISTITPFGHNSWPILLVSAKKKCKKAKEVYAIETKKYIPVPYPVKSMKKPKKKKKKKSSVPKTIVVTIPDKKEEDCCDDYDYYSIAPPLYYDYYQYYGGGGAGAGGLGGFGGGGLGGFGGGGLGGGGLGGGGFGGGGLGIG